ncbi:hypothetical protein [Vibrio sp. WXL103]|uniref:hypothetical protein n=1 Tax=unclassified Vibrio TaxID=2614977 RepID=UPI003EC512BD
MTPPPLKRTLITLAIAVQLSSIPNVNATGFPTIDGANLIQSLIEYMTVLKEYEQMLQQTGLSANQLLTLIEQYEQTLREYDVLLNQVAQLEHKIARRDYNGIVKEGRKLYDEYGGRYGDDSTTNTDQVVRRHGEMTQKDELETLSHETFGYVPDDISQSYLFANDANTNERMREHLQGRNRQNQDDIAHLDSLRTDLGDQSELATLQLLVEQNQVLLNQISTLTDLQMASFTNNNNALQQSSQAEYRAHIERLKRIKYENENPIEIDERSLR